MDYDDLFQNGRLDLNYEWQKFMNQNQDITIAFRDSSLRKNIVM